MSKTNAPANDSLFEAPPMGEQERMVEAILFATAEPVTVRELNSRMPHGCDAAEALVDWVHGYLIKAPTLSVPNALEVLRLGQGDCNEHTALYVALARIAGIPSRIAAGVVYSDAMGENGGFYYHAWPEVYLGEVHGWVPVDPTFGQFPADASHVKLVEGDLDKQVEIMGVMGRLGFKMVESR